MQSRRDLLTGGAGLAVAGALPALASGTSSSDPLRRQPCLQEELSLEGEWAFSRDPDGRDWTTVRVPHTWQITPGLEEYRGLAWYRRDFAVPHEWRSSAIRIEFEAVFHSATVWVNGALAGSHLRKGYTSFVLDITSFLRYGAENVIVVRVDGAFDDSMLPRGRSSDWAHDGGIYRPVRLIITAPVFIERLAVDAIPKLAAAVADRADIEIHATVRNSATTRWRGQIGCRVVEIATQKSALQVAGSNELVLEPGERRTLTLGGTIAQPRLWHFDHPNLYAARVALHQEATVVHELDATFGIRTIEVRDGAIHLNGEKIRLMGVERMAGSNPEFGMAEPAAWITHDHGDLKNLNCTLTRVHWQQDRRVLDYCDRHGILLQSEIPAWGWETFQGMGAHPLAELMRNGLEQLREMIERDRNHPCIIAWGLCNEVNGQDPAAYEFAQRLYGEAKQLDPSRLCSYASNSLAENPQQDVSGQMDFIECNEYFGTWTPGTPEDLKRHLLQIHRTFPDKPIVISEYGYCACVPERPEGDERRIEILREHTRVCRELEFVAGLIFFCYNDYRTHVGDKGGGATLQRVHGVVDLYGNRKPSYDVLREESSPVEWLRIAGRPGDFVLTLKARQTIPAHVMTGYTVRGVLYGDGEIPLERRLAELPVVAPGEQATVAMRFAEKNALRIVFDVLRPTAFSAWTEIWRAQ